MVGSVGGPPRRSWRYCRSGRTGCLSRRCAAKYGVNAAQMYRWKRSLEQELKESGEMVPKSQVLGLQSVYLKCADGNSLSQESPLGLDSILLRHNPYKSA